MVWKSLASNNIQAARTEQLARPPVSWVQTCVVQAHPRLRIENQNQTWQQEK